MPNPTLLPVLLAIADKTAPGSGPDMTRYLLVCAGLLAAIGVAAFLFKKLIAGTMKSRAAQRSLQVMDLLPLGHKQRVCVVRVYDRTFALGLGDKEVALIAELDPVIAPRGGDASPPERAEFEQLLERAHQHHDVAPGAAKPRRSLTELLRNGGLLG